MGPFDDHMIEPCVNIILFNLGPGHVSWHNGPLNIIKHNKVLIMTQIDFYIIKKPNTTPLSIACRLASKAYEKDHKVVLMAQNDLDAAQLDDALWTITDISFIPHCLAKHAISSTPIIIVTPDSTPSDIQDILINIGANVPNNYSDFARIMEVVGTQDEQKAQGRARYKAYQAQGHEINTHSI